MARPARKSRRNALLRLLRSPFLVPTAAAITIVSGTIINHHLGLPWLPSLYATMQVFTTGLDVVPPSPTADSPVPDWAAWDTAAWLFRLAVPVLSAVALVRVAHVLGWIRRPLFLSRNHVVIAGAGRIGAELGRHLLADGHDVIVVDHDADNPRLVELEALGARTFVGDASREATLEAVRVHRAVAVIATTREDLVNVDVAFRALALHPRPDCFRTFSHVSDGPLRELLGDICRQRTAPLEFFSIYEYAADHVYDEHVRRHAEPPARIVIAGFGRFGESVLRRVVNDLTDGHGPSCLVIDRDETRRCRFEQLRSHVPREHQDRIELCIGDILEPRIVHEMQVGEGRRMVVVATDDDVRNLDLALTLARRTRGAVAPCDIVTRMFRWPPAFMSSPVTRGLLPEIGAVNIHALLRERFVRERLHLPPPWWTFRGFPTRRAEPTGRPSVAP
jgi:Trk K+ transport system NAD-binding subunit